MTGKMTASAALARRYVTALLASAGQNPGLAVLRTELAKLAQMIESSPDLQRVLTLAILPINRQERVVAAVLSAAKFSDAVQAFVRVIIQNRRGGMLPAFIAAALDEIDVRDGIARADVTVATPLAATHQKALTEILSRWTGARVGLNIIVSPEVLGGIKIRLGSMLIDDSVAGKLARLKQTLGASA